MTVVEINEADSKSFTKVDADLVLLTTFIANICHMFKQLVDYLAARQSIMPSTTDTDIMRLFTYAPESTIGVIDLDATQEAVVRVKISECQSIRLILKKNSAGYATASLNSCYDIVKGIVKHDFYFYCISTMTILPFTERLCTFVTGEQQPQVKIAVARIVTKGNCASRVKREIMLVVKDLEITLRRLDSQKRMVDGKYCPTLLIVVELSATVDDVLDYLTDYILKDNKPPKDGANIKLTSDISESTLETLLLSNNLLKAKYVPLTKIIDFTTDSSGYGYSKILVDYTKKKIRTDTLCVNGNFLQTILPFESMNTGEKLSKYLSPIGPRLLLIRFPELILKCDINLIQNPPSGLFQQTEKPDTKYRLLSIITSISGYYDVLTNHNDYCKLEKSCKLMSNVEGEMTVSLNEILPRVNCMLYQLSTSIDD